MAKQKHQDKEGEHLSGIAAVDMARAGVGGVAAALLYDKVIVRATTPL